MFGCPGGKSRCKFVQMNIFEQARARRAERIAGADQRRFDLIILGGGVHGAYCAREAVAAGLSVLLLEARDFAGATSSRSSKLLHGGIRYLEQGSFGLVRQALRQRAHWLKIAPHLTRPQPFIFPIIAGLTRPAWQIRIGLSIYDLLFSGWRSTESGVETVFPRHQVEPVFGPLAEELSSLGLKFSSLFRYYDGQMDDFRLVLESVRAAETRGATALNYAEAESITRSSGEPVEWSVVWRDTLSAVTKTSRAGHLINCCGPWAAKVHQLAGAPARPAPEIVWSRGIHLYFRRRWTLPALILPTAESGRVYWVLPYFYGGSDITLVGTTDRMTDRPEHSPDAAAEEIEELLRYLARDLPGAGLNRDSLINTICGIRTLVGENADGTRIQTSAIGREEEMIFAPGYSSLFGGKFTTAPHVAARLAKPAIDEFGAAAPGLIVSEPLPGGVGWSSLSPQIIGGELKRRFASASDGAPISDELVQLAVFTLGMRCRELVIPPAARITGIGNGQSRGDLLLLAALIDTAILEDQGWDAADVLTRRVPIFTLGPQSELLKQAAAELMAV